MMSTRVLIAVCWFVAVQALPPDKEHQIDKRSIDLNEVSALVTSETEIETTVTPNYYILDIETYIYDGVYKGRVEINITWFTTSDHITVYAAHELEINDVEVTVYGKNGLESIAIKRASSDPKRPIYTIHLEREIAEDAKGNLTILFNGNLNTASNYGFFKTSFARENDSESIIVAANLRSTYARRMFPCFDEPKYKANVQLNLVAPRHLTVLSNTKLQFNDHNYNLPTHQTPLGTGGLSRIQFEQTPMMTMYSFGLVIADLQMLQNASRVYQDDLGNLIELRVWGRREFLPALVGVIPKAFRALKELAEFWVVPLPLRKIDFVALPNFKGVKPADSWGLILFKESDLSSQGYLQLAQELTYQWVGALTTPRWWNNALVNKALVGYLAAETAFKINNGSEMEGKWPMTVLYSLYYEYSKRFPHSRITGMKQETACTKIELVFRMFNYTLGAEVFRNGMRRFMQDSRYLTFTDDDIWHNMNKDVIEAGRLPKGLTVEKIANSWIKADRLPLVKVERNYEKKSAVVTQKLYLRERPHDVTEEFTWNLPVVMVSGNTLNFSQTTPKIWLTEKQATIENVAEDNEILIVNPEEIAPYPVNYDETNWNLLIKYLKSENRTRIPELTRAKLLHDTWNLGFAGELKFSIALDMTLFLKNERHHLVWDPVFTMIDHIGNHLCTCLRPKFHAYIRSLLSPLYEELSSNIKDDEESWRGNLRSITKTFLCKAGYKPCIKEAQEHYAKWMKVKNPDEGNPISNQYICPVFKWGTREEWEFGLQRVINFPESRKQSERTYLLKTLAGCPTETERVMKLLNITILEENGNFTENDVFLIFSMLTGAPEGYTALFQFLTNNWDVLKQKFGNKTNLWDSLINSATGHFKTKDGLEMITNLYNAHKGKFASAEHIIEKNIRVTKEEAKWSDENQPVIEKWLDQYLAQNKLKDTM